MRKVISWVLNLLIAAFVLWAWLNMTFRPDRHGLLSTGGFQNLRYFTVLSNLLQGGVSLVRVFGRRTGRWKYVSTTAVALTFFVVLLFLGPAYGYDSMYTGANFWFHLVVPVLAMADFLIFDRADSFTLRDSFVATLPMLAYSLFYVVNLLVNGVKGNDWYGFAKDGPKSAVAAFLIILATNWVIALLLRLPRRRRGHARGGSPDGQCP